MIVEWNVRFTFASDKFKKFPYHEVFRSNEFMKTTSGISGFKRFRFYEDDHSWLSLFLT